jgi:hypothetical protein
MRAYVPTIQKTALAENIATGGKDAFSTLRQWLND